MNIDLALALELADIADTITLAAFRDPGLVVESKADLTLVSAADRGAEEMLRNHLSAVRPKDSIWGEEFGETEGEPGGLRWVLDPIDGTHNFVRGIPVWATLIAAERDGVPVVGVVSAPALHRRWWAAKGEGAFAGDNLPIRVSKVDSLDGAQLSCGWEKMLVDPAYVALTQRCWRTRGFGDFWSLVLVAEGAVEIAIEPGYRWDLAAPQVIVEEAGGTFTDRNGGSALDAQMAVATNGLLHDAVLEALKG